MAIFKRYRLLFAIATASAVAIFTTLGLYSRRDPGPIMHGTSEFIQVKDGNGVPHRVWVYRRSGPDSRRLHVLYFLHGQPGNATDVQTQLQSIIDKWHRHDLMVVAPDGNGTDHDDTEWANAADGTDQIETFVTTQLIDAVEGKNRRDTAHRAIAGFSMGGYGAVNIGLHHPELYGQVGSIDGYFKMDDPSGMFGHDAATEQNNDPNAHAIRAANRRFYLAEDTSHELVLVSGEAKRFAPILKQDRARVRVDMATGHHDWSFVRQQMPALERFLDAGWGPSGP